MNWEQRVVISCKEKGLEVVGFDGGWVFIKNARNEIYPVRETIIAMRMGEK